MIPTTLTGLLLLIVALLPGLVFVALHDRRRPVRKLSAFRETATVLMVSVMSYIPVIGLSLIAAFAIPGRRTDLTSFLIDPDNYRVDHAWRFTVAAIVGVAVATGLAALGGWKEPWSSKKADPEASAWWQLLSGEGDIPPKAARFVSAYLKDGSVLAGYLRSFSREADEHGDRDLVLQSWNEPPTATIPLRFQSPTGRIFHELDGAAIIVSAREIQFL